MEEDYQKWFQSFLSPYQFRRLSKTIWLLGYKSFFEYFSAYQDALYSAHDNPTSYGTSPYMLRHARLNIWNYIRYYTWRLDLYFSPKTSYNFIVNKMLKQILSDRFNDPSETSETIRLAIQLEKSYAKALGIDNSTIINHLAYLLQRKLSAEHYQQLNNQSEPVIPQDLRIEKTENLNPTVDAPYIIAAPKIQLGVLGETLPAIAEDLERSNLIPDALAFRALFDTTLLTLEKFADWNHSLITLMYLIERLIDRKIVDPEQSPFIPGALEGRARYQNAERTRQLQQSQLITRAVT